ncbi:MAG: hypothetical protein K9N05_02255 [Candidatus Marinimicrobia bacterium]|nr:hypothetical protein [Candidatus Neomarinimicrobiota bacterium]
MSVERAFQVAMVGCIMIVKIAGAQDSLIHPDALSAQALDEYENDAKISFRLGFGENISYRVKTQFEYCGFNFFYLAEGEEKDPEQTVSFSAEKGCLKAGIGQGQPNISKGLILGNTMMRFTPDLSNNAGISPGKLSIKNYNYYARLEYCDVKFRDMDMSAFRYDGNYCAMAQYARSEWNAGMAYFALIDPILETWAEYKNKTIRANFDLSLAKWNLNHICGDILYKRGGVLLYGGAVYTHHNFQMLKSDSKWGSGLKAGSQGYSGGISLSSSLLKLKSFAYCVFRDNYQEQRCMIDLGFKKKPCEIILSYCSKTISELDENKHFPFEQDWQEEKNRICKMNVKFQIQKQLQFSYQIQGDILHPRSYVSVLRLTYRRSDDLIRLQLSKCRSLDNALYFLRPLTASAYSIRRAPNIETSYIDLLYSKDIGIMRIYILLRNEGINVGFSIEN